MGPPCHCFICIFWTFTGSFIAQDTFEVVFLANVEYATDAVWLENIKNDWGATGILLRIDRSIIDRRFLNPPPPGDEYLWDHPSFNYDLAFEMIESYDLDIYVKVTTMYFNLDLVDTHYFDDDFHIRYNGERFYNRYFDPPNEKPMLNLTSPKATGDLLTFFDEVVDHLNNDLTSNIRDRIKLLVPGLSPDNETEFPFNTLGVVEGELTGYSVPEIEEFMVFLNNRYGSVENLNETWGDGASFGGINSNDIVIQGYKWEIIRDDPNDYYLYEPGRRDFLDFRTKELKDFIDGCATRAHNGNFNLGVQFGSLYDWIIEFRGFYDPTSLIENVDYVITDEILEYEPNFTFAADYSRSLCSFWERQGPAKKKIKFATETNWPG